MNIFDGNFFPSPWFLYLRKIVVISTYIIHQKLILFCIMENWRGKKVQRGTYWFYYDNHIRFRYRNIMWNMLVTLKLVRIQYHLMRAFTYSTAYTIDTCKMKLTNVAHLWNLLSLSSIHLFVKPIRFLLRFFFLPLSFSVSSCDIQIVIRVSSNMNEITYF